MPTDTAVPTLPDTLGAGAREFIAGPHRLLIGAERPEAADGRTFATLDPASGREIAHVPQAGPADVAGALAANATTPNATLAAASLGAADPTDGGNFLLPTADAKALGLLSGYDGLDGYIGFSSTYPFTYNPSNRSVAGDYDFIGVAEHEMTEVMGRISLLGETIASIPDTYSALDLFRYSAPGARRLVAGKTAYLSINGGGTDLLAFNTIVSGDAGDWNGATTDAFNAFVHDQMMRDYPGDKPRIDDY